MKCRCYRRVVIYHEVGTTYEVRSVNRSAVVKVVVTCCRQKTVDHLLQKSAFSCLKSSQMLLLVIISQMLKLKNLALFDILLNLKKMAWLSLEEGESEIGGAISEHLVTYVKNIETCT